MKLKPNPYHDCPAGHNHCFCQGFKGLYFGDPPRSCCKCGKKVGGNPMPKSYMASGDD